MWIKFGFRFEAESHYNHLTEKIDPQKQMDFKYLELNLSLTEHSKFGFYFLFFILK